MTDDQQPLLTLAQVAKRLQMSPRFVQLEVARGNLRASRLGGRLRFTEAALKTYVDANSTIAAPSTGRTRKKRRP